MCPPSEISFQVIAEARAAQTAADWLGVTSTSSLAASLSSPLLSAAWDTLISQQAKLVLMKCFWNIDKYFEAISRGRFSLHVLPSVLDGILPSHVAFTCMVSWGILPYVTFLLQFRQFFEHPTWAGHSTRTEQACCSGGSVCWGSLNNHSGWSIGAGSLLAGVA